VARLSAADVISVQPGAPHCLDLSCYLSASSVGLHVSSTTRETLQEAFGPAYVLERELRGGMSRVFVATETALHRTVVLKVLPPELAAGLSADRFRREIQVVARLQHPHIVPLLSAGQAGEFLYYTMPYVEGESLRTRLAREGELPVDSAVRIMAGITRALAYAHRHGIIHRDIKPDNILLTDGEAQVADFGIAKAVSAASAEQGTLTSIGLALGTPAYMAPEQAAAEPTVDHRADLYALGIVAYEMLAGEPPFHGRSPAQVLAAHATQPPPPLRNQRPAVPVPLADLVTRLLEKHPADRPQNAEDVLRLLEAAETPAASAPTIAADVRPGHRRERLSRGQWLVAGGVATLAIVLAIAWLTNREKLVRVDRTVVAVAPFRVSGADSSLGYLREGMVDLLGAKLSGVSGLRAADPRTLLAAWRRAAGRGGDLAEDAAIRVAERVGAGRLIEGDVVGTPQQITLNAVLRDAPGAKVDARASVEGSPDSIPRLVDRLAGKLLALEAGEGEQRLASLTSTSFPALRAYLEGQALVRRGSFRQAADQFNLALQQDSTFALAGLGLTRASVWFGESYEGPGSLIAWRYREKLAPRDRALLDVYLGTRWPARVSTRDRLGAAERFVQIAPDNAEAWLLLGDNLYHFGPLLGIADAHRRAAEAFGRALALDSSFAPALEHGTVLALAFGDTAGARAAHARMLRVDSTSSWATSDRWVLAAALGDSSERRKALESDSLDANFMMEGALSLGLPQQDVDRVFRAQSARATTTDEHARLGFSSHMYSMITGQPSRAVPLPGTIPESARLAILAIEAHFTNGDSVAGAQAGAVLERTIGTPLAPRVELVAARFAGGQWALDLGHWDAAARAVSDLRNAPVPPDRPWFAEVPSGFALILEAELAARRRSAQLPQLLSSLDSAMTNPGFFAIPLIGNLIAARLYHEQGSLPQALAAIRRRVFDLDPNPLYVTYQLEEARLAALSGDRVGAIRAYQGYLAQRSGAEPRLQPPVAAVRGELQELERENPDR
jgi:tetratricopeptide (TPR) repeat protein